MMQSADDNTKTVPSSESVSSGIGLPDNVLPDNGASGPPATFLQKYGRLLALVGVMAALFVVGWQMGLLSDVQGTFDRLRVFVRNAGPYGVVLFLAIYASGELVHIPGFIFFATGVIVFGKFWGLILGFVGSMMAAVVVFFMVRRIGGQALTKVKWKWVKTILSRLEQHPIRIISITRIFLWNAPQLNYAFALSNVRFRDYFVGTSLGLMVPCVIQVLLFDVLMGWFGLRLRG